MSNEDKEYAIGVMMRMPLKLRRAYREANALVGMLEPLCLDEQMGESGFSITISRAMMHSICTLAEGLRDALSATAQQARSIANMMSVPNAWDTPDGEDDDDSSGSNR